MLVQNTFQYKQCLCILTIPKCKDLHDLQTRKKKLRVAIGCELSFCKYKNEKYCQISLLPRISTHSVHWHINPPTKTPFVFFH